MGDVSAAITFGLVPAYLYLVRGQRGRGNSDNVRGYRPILVKRLRNLLF